MVRNKGGNAATTKRKIEIFSVGCPFCEEAVRMVERIACSSCEVSVLDLKDPVVAKRAHDMGIRSAPAVAVDGKPVNCCAGRGIDEAELRSAGIGRPLSV